VLALATAMAGCAATDLTKPIKRADAPVVVEPTIPTSRAVEPRAVAALPQRVAAIPQYVPEERAAPAVVARPIYEPVRPAPVVEPAPRYEAAPSPTYEAVETVAIREPVIALPDTSQYTATGDLDAPPPSPSYEIAALSAPVAAAPRVRSMAPIRDEPQDGRDRVSAETRIHARKGYRRNAALRAGGLKPKVRSNYTPAFGMKLEQAALGRLNPAIRYDARYVKIAYPWGDVPETTGVCSDVIIRSYRALGIDLQSLLHEDMKRAFRAYPSKRIYGLKRPDPNIDHRRVVNLEAFFERTGASIPVGTEPDDFQPGDVLTWRLSGNEPHTGIVIAERHPTSGYPLVVHNLGAGVRKDDLIKLSPPTGHFRFAPDTDTVVASLR
jgi:uncharacterized protein YijF (DUF1287 family)